MTGSVEARALARVRRRLIPFLFVLYVVSYLDRINVGFAALQMNAALGFSPAVYGLGAGIFFVSYFLFEIPSNLILARIGARVWIARIMISWGLVSVGMMLVSGPRSFLLLRFLLGAAEAGFFPGIILYLTYWFPARERARAIAQFMTATALAGVIGGPLSGALLSMRALGLAGWQWMFLIEGLPAIVLGVVVSRYLTDRPEQASWLAEDERAWLSKAMHAEQTTRAREHKMSLREALLNPGVWRLSVLYFMIVIGLYGISFWLPQLVKGFAGLSDLAVGFISAIPYAVAALCMVFVAAHSDRTGERRFHVAAPAFVAAVGFLITATFPSPAVSLLGLSLAAAGIWGAVGPFWTLPTAFLSGASAAGGIALINSVGNLGGFLGPYLLGAVKEATGSFSGGMFVLAMALLFAGLIAVSLHSDHVTLKGPVVRVSGEGMPA